MKIIKTNINEIPKGILSVNEDHILLVKPGLFGSKKRTYTFDEIVDLEVLQSLPGFGYGSGSFEKYAPDGFNNNIKVTFRDGSWVITNFFSSKMTGWTANEMITQMEKLCDVANRFWMKDFLYPDIVQAFKHAR